LVDYGKTTEDPYKESVLTKGWRSAATLYRKGYLASAIPVRSSLKVGEKVTSDLSTWAFKTSDYWENKRKEDSFFNYPTNAINELSSSAVGATFGVAHTILNPKDFINNIKFMAKTAKNIVRPIAVNFSMRDALARGDEQARTKLDVARVKRGYALDVIKPVLKEVASDPLDPDVLASLFLGTSAMVRIPNTLSKTKNLVGTTRKITSDSIKARKFKVSKELGDNLLDDTKYLAGTALRSKAATTLTEEVVDEKVFKNYALGGSILKTVASFGRGLFKKDRLENVKKESSTGSTVGTIVNYNEKLKNSLDEALDYASGGGVFSTIGSFIKGLGAKKAEDRLNAVEKYSSSGSTVGTISGYNKKLKNTLDEALDYASGGGVFSGIADMAGKELEKYRLHKAQEVQEGNILSKIADVGLQAGAATLELGARVSKGLMLDPLSTVEKVATYQAQNGIAATIDAGIEKAKAVGNFVGNLNTEQMKNIGSGIKQSFIDDVSTGGLGITSGILSTLAPSGQITKGLKTVAPSVSKGFQTAMRPLANESGFINLEVATGGISKLKEVLDNKKLQSQFSSLYKKDYTRQAGTSIYNSLANKIGYDAGTTLSQLKTSGIPNTPEKFKAFSEAVGAGPLDFKQFAGLFKKTRDEYFSPNKPGTVVRGIPTENIMDELTKGSLGPQGLVEILGVDPRDVFKIKAGSAMDDMLKTDRQAALKKLYTQGTGHNYGVHATGVNVGITGKPGDLGGADLYGATKGSGAKATLIYDDVVRDLVKKGGPEVARAKEAATTAVIKGGIVPGHVKSIMLGDLNTANDVKKQLKAAGLDFVKLIDTEGVPYKFAFGGKVRSRKSSILSDASLWQRVEKYMVNTHANTFGTEGAWQNFINSGVGFEELFADQDINRAQATDRLKKLYAKYGEEKTSFRDQTKHNKRGLSDDTVSKFVYQDASYMPGNVKPKGDLIKDNRTKGAWISRKEFDLRNSSEAEGRVAELRLAQKAAAMVNLSFDGITSRNSKLDEQYSTELVKYNGMDKWESSAKYSKDGVPLNEAARSLEAYKKDVKAYSKAPEFTEYEKSEVRTPFSSNMDVFARSRRANENVSLMTKDRWQAYLGATDKEGKTIRDTNIAIPFLVKGQEKRYYEYAKAKALASGVNTENWKVQDYISSLSETDKLDSDTHKMMQGQAVLSKWQALSDNAKSPMEKAKYQQAADAHASRMGKDILIRQRHQQKLDKVFGKARTNYVPTHYDNILRYVSESGIEAAKADGSIFQKGDKWFVDRRIGQEWLASGSFISEEAQWMLRNNNANFVEKDTARREKEKNLKVLMKQAPWLSKILTKGFNIMGGGDKSGAISAQEAFKYFFGNSNANSSSVKHTGGMVGSTGNYLLERGELVVSKNFKNGGAVANNFRSYAEGGEVGSNQIPNTQSIDTSVIENAIVDALSSVELKVEDKTVKVDVGDSKVPVDMEGATIKVDVGDVSVPVEVPTEALKVNVEGLSIPVDMPVEGIKVDTTSLDDSINKLASISIEGTNSVGAEKEDKLAVVLEELNSQISDLKDLRETDLEMLNTKIEKSSGDSRVTSIIEQSQLDNANIIKQINEVDSSIGNIMSAQDRQAMVINEKLSGFETRLNSITTKVYATAAQSSLNG